MTNKFQELDRVYYTEHGPSDGGVIVAVVGGRVPYSVLWDDGSPVDGYAEDQLTLSSPDDIRI